LVIGAAIEVHRELGPGLLEAVYEECLCRELQQRSIPFERQKSIPISYKGQQLETDYRLDLLVRSTVVVELKAIESLRPVHFAQLLSYLVLTDSPLGLLINFNEALLRDGIRRVANRNAGFLPVAPGATAVVADHRLCDFVSLWQKEQQCDSGPSTRAT